MHKLFRDVFIFIATLFLFLALCGCGGNSATPVISDSTVAPAGAAASAFPQTLPVDRAQPWERLGADGRIIPQRSVSSIDANTEFVPGVERYLEGGTVADLGEASALSSGLTGVKELSYAMYRIPLGADQPGAIAVDANLRPRVGQAALSGYYLGLSNYTKSRWEWHGPYSDYHVRLSTGAAVRAGGGYTSPLGDLFICIAAYDGANFDVVGVGANRYDAADTTPPAVPDGLTITSCAGGLKLQWNAVLASDLAGYRIYWRKAAFTDPHSPGVAAVSYLEGATLHFLAVPVAVYSVAVAAVDLSGNESGISTVAADSPYPGSPPPLVVTVDAASVQRSGPVTLTATGAVNYDFDINGDGVMDLTNATGVASVDTTGTGIIRPFVIGWGADSRMSALGGVSLIVLGNTRPVASAVASPQSGLAPLGVTFTGTASDIEDALASLTFAWDFDGDGTYDASTNTRTPPKHAFNAPGLYNAKFRVTDSQGAWAVGPVTVQADPGGVNYTVLVDDNMRNVGTAAIIDGMMAVVYQDIAFNLYYARAKRADATAWNAPVLVHSLGSDIGKASLTTVNGFPAVAYSTLMAGNLYYSSAADPQGTTWNPAVYVGGPNNGYSCELVEANGRPAIGYHNNSTDRPVFNRADDAAGSTWTGPVDVDAAGRGGTCATAIVNGLPAMAYRDTALASVYYAQATDVDGAGWGPPVLLSSSIDSNSLDLQVTGGLPSVAIGDATNYAVWFIRAYDPNGTAWKHEVAAVQRIGGGLMPAYVSLAEFDSRPAIAFEDMLMSDAIYCEATGINGSYWQTPVTLAPNTMQDSADGLTPLLNLNGLAAVGCKYYVSSALKMQLRILRLYR